MLLCGISFGRIARILLILFFLPAGQFLLQLKDRDPEDPQVLDHALARAVACCDRYCMQQPRYGGSPALFFVVEPAADPIPYRYKEDETDQKEDNAENDQQNDPDHFQDRQKYCHRSVLRMNRFSSLAWTFAHQHLPSSQERRSASPVSA